MGLPGHIDEADGAALLAVRVIPRGSRDAIVGVRGDSLAVRVGAEPVEGKANERLRKLVAKACGVPASRVEIVRGVRSRQKLLRIEGIGAADAARRLARAQE